MMEAFILSAVQELGCPCFSCNAGYCQTSWWMWFISHTSHELLHLSVTFFEFFSTNLSSLLIHFSPRCVSLRGLKMNDKQINFTSNNPLFQISLSIIANIVQLYLNEICATIHIQTFNQSINVAMRVIYQYYLYDFQEPTGNKTQWTILLVQLCVCSVIWHWITFYLEIPGLAISH